MEDGEMVDDTVPPATSAAPPVVGVANGLRVEVAVAAPEPCEENDTFEDPVLAPDS